MSKHRRNWTLEEKEQIVLFSETNGVSKASREYGISSVSIYKWKEQLNQSGNSSLSSSTTTSLEQELKKLRRENQALKRIVADKELALQVKDSLLKKSQFQKK